ncbi:hypothetical protein PENSTE_c025G00697 [Penicillium steckii]|uniref:Sugar phosphate transporter domain-containing protein n=1 Tax=Penicillium steckii TaxID=303698 RepID=A0A1V6SQ04_9EURO|nr:hypothetical protein PENSTE_c025G00697 [Penicillium steckii]
MINDDASLKSDTYTLRQLNRSSNTASTTTATTTTPSATDTAKKDNPSKSSQNAEILAAAAHATVPNWTNLFLMISLIFGGCCSNVFALEAIIKEQPTSGPLITFAQFILCSLLTLPTFLQPSLKHPLKPRAIPLKSWLIYTAYFVSVNLLNNWAFAYKISVPLHIILRSGGPVASMGIGYLFRGRRYSNGQVVSVAMLSIGVMAAALADANSKTASTYSTDSTSNSSGSVSKDGVNAEETLNTIIGFSILLLAMILSAFQGLYADALYSTYGRTHWKEALFYSHTLSLPLFLPNYTQLSSQWKILSSSPPFQSSSSYLGVSSYLGIFGIGSGGGVPSQIIYLIINALTQYACIRGVHLLSAKSSSLTVTVALNIRKLVSLLLSIWLFGNRLEVGVVFGAVLVFLGGGLYGVESGRIAKIKQKEKSHSS